MQTRELKTLIVATALLPSLLIALALGGYLGFSRLQDIDDLLRERGAAAALQLALAVRQPLAAADSAALAELAALALEERGLRSAVLFSPQRQPLASAGPLLRRFDTIHLDGQSRIQPFDETLRFLQPIWPGSHYTAVLRGGEASTATQPLGWVVLEYSRQPYLLQRYHSLFVVGAIIALAVIAAAIIAALTSHRLAANLATLREGVRRIAEGRFDTPIHPGGDSELDGLAAEINQLALNIQGDLIDLQRNLEQTNRDLRESLETVEVQNIELDLARREALEASRIKSEFLANTSHELRTPLNGIIGFTKLLLKSEVEPRQREYLETIRYSAENLLTIINDILDFSKIEAGKLVLDNVPLDLRELIEETLAILAPSAFEKSLDLLLLYDSEVPPALVGDPLRLRQILTNLISNGIKFTGSGHIVVRASLTGEVGARVPLRISVTDTGIGLSENQQKQLFRAFAQADASTSRVFGGTGLGLAISKRLVEQMGGEIGLESQPGQGATFWFSVRLRRQPKPLHSRGFDQLVGRRLGLYDSAPLSQLALRQLLESWGVQVETLASWEQLRGSVATQRLDGWLVSLSHAELARDQLAQLPAGAAPTWVLLPGHTTDHPCPSGIELLAKPVGHVALYDRLCTPGSLPPPMLALPVAAAHVLAVDDNAANLKLLGVLLEELGAVPHLASGGRQALGLCDSRAFDLILMDIQMPEINGLQAMQLIRAGNNPNRKSRIVALTAHLLPEEQRQLLAAGFDLCMTKPITEEQLAGLLTRSELPLPAPAPSSGEQVRPVDLGICLQRAQRKPELARELLEGLLESLPSLRENLAAQWQGGQLDPLLETTHKLHGACCYTGVPRLQNRSRALEDQLKRDREPAAMATATEALLAAIDELIDWQAEHDLDVLFAMNEA